MKIVSVRNQLTFPLTFTNLQTETDNRPLPAGLTYTFGGHQEGCDIPTLGGLTAENWSTNRMIISGPSIPGQTPVQISIFVYNLFEAPQEIFWAPLGVDSAVPEVTALAPIPVSQSATLPLSDPYEIIVTSTGALRLDSGSFPANTGDLFAIKNGLDYPLSFQNMTHSGDNVASIPAFSSGLTAGGNNQGCDIPQCMNLSDWNNKSYMTISPTNGGNAFIIYLYKQHNDVFYTLGNTFPTVQTPLPGGLSQSDGQKKVLIINDETDIQLVDAYARVGLEELPCWMQTYSAILGPKQLDQIMLPGSHDSGTFAFDQSLMKFAPGVPDFVPIATKSLWGAAAGFGAFFVGPVVVPAALNAFAFNIVAIRFSKAQDVDIAAQLQLGIRYLDLRVAPNPNDSNNLYLIHGFWGANLTEALNDIKSFVLANSKEIVILDFNHFYTMTLESHTKLAAQLSDIFGALSRPADVILIRCQPTRIAVTDFRKRLFLNACGCISTSPLAYEKWN